MTHTPGEWTAHEGDVFAGKDRIAICDTDNATPERYRANAARIVRACNAHDELVDALADLLAAFTDPRSCEYDEAAATRRARAALSKAEGR